MSNEELRNRMQQALESGKTVAFVLDFAHVMSHEQMLFVMGGLAHVVDGHWRPGQVGDRHE